MFQKFLCLVFIQFSVGSDELERIAEVINNWRPEHGTYIWEHSGRYQGDIHKSNLRNALKNETAHWPHGIIPYKIDKFSFTDNETKTINSAIDEFHKKTCLKLRPKKKSDKNYVHFVSTSSGCWSSVGMQGGEQKLNLQTPNCVRFGVVIHELLHAVGFYHQQSASNRDDFVRINWDNIIDGTEHNFNKYNDSVVTDYGIGYDYKSVMHYSSLAFTKNKKPTIEPLKTNVTTLGQREGFSEKDLKKLSKMYEGYCEGRSKEESEVEDSYENWMISVFGWLP